MRKARLGPVGSWQILFSLGATGALRPRLLQLRGRGMGTFPSPLCPTPQHCRQPLPSPEAMPPAQHLNWLCCLMSLQLFSAFPFPASLVWFGGFCACFLGLSFTVPDPLVVVWGLPPPGAVPSREEDGGRCSDQGMILPRLGCSSGPDGMRVGKGPF